MESTRWRLQRMWYRPSRASRKFWKKSYCCTSHVDNRKIKSRAIVEWTCVQMWQDTAFSWYTQSNRSWCLWAALHSISYKDWSNTEVLHNIIFVTLQCGPDHGFENYTENTNILISTITLLYNLKQGNSNSLLIQAYCVVMLTITL